jgi:integrase
MRAALLRNRWRFHRNTHFFEHGDYLAVAEALPDYLRPVLSFGYLTGWRKSEIINLKWKQIDMEARTVRLDPGRTKNEKGRVIALEGDLWEIIRTQWEKRKVAEVPGQSPTLLCPSVFHREGKPIKTFRSAWEWACKKTGLAGKLFHDLSLTSTANDRGQKFFIPWRRYDNPKSL